MVQQWVVKELKKRLVEQHQERLHEFLSRYQPYDIAQMMLDLKEHEQFDLINSMSAAFAAEVLEYVEPEVQYHILDRAEERTALILNELSSDKVVDLMVAIHPHQAQILLKLLPDEHRQKIEALMCYPEKTAGSLATIDYIAVRSNWTVEHTLQHIRKVGQDAEMIAYIYIMDSIGRLVGIASLKDVILADGGLCIEAIMKKDLITVPAQMDQQEVAQQLSNYDLVALPVVTEEHRMIGMITVDDLIDVIHEEATEDIQKLGGSEPLNVPYFEASIWSIFKKRLPWLLILFVAEAYTGTVLKHFEDTLEQVVALAFFVPLLVGTGGNTGTQVVATIIRAVGVGEVKFKDIFRVIKREATVGLCLGLMMGVAGLIRASILGVGFEVAQVVAITMLCIVVWSSIIASALPLIIRKLKLDPAVVSGPFITTFVDGTGLVIYFMVAKAVLNL
ncbi:magnesium transporter [Paenibacillus aquistagni]|uniref:magnesium transporter n=1 Tax=Paenibacillus aquistagni TaxID=1852522 RepID=UPI000B50ED90|nr:magnesium transporter [Paenibacillus aquistagni]